MSNTVLVVDDNKSNIDALARILTPTYTVMAAVGGETAVRIMAQRQPDLVLLDVYMPGMNGMDVLAHMQKKPELAGVPVILLTGEQGGCVEEEGLALGAVDYIKKPYNASIILHKIHNHLEHKNHRDHLEAMVSARTRQLAASREAIIMGMSLLSESHDKITGYHIQRIKEFTRILCRGMQRKHPDLMPEATLASIVLYAPLHDVGKVGVTDVILKKEGTLTPEEFDIMKTHTLTGAQLLRKTERYYKYGQEEEHLNIAIEIAESHHEKYDGTGYPHGLRGDAIPLSARIVAIADIYDALRSPRPYKNPFGHEEACRILLQGDNRTKPVHFDPRVLAVFADVMDEFGKTYVTTAGLTTTGVDHYHG